MRSSNQKLQSYNCANWSLEFCSTLFCNRASTIHRDSCSHWHQRCAAFHLRLSPGRSAEVPEPYPTQAVVGELRPPHVVGQTRLRDNTLFSTTGAAGRRGCQPESG